MKKNELATTPIYKGYEVKNVKTGFGHDMAGYSGTLYKDGKKIALINDDGYGGETEIYWAWVGRLKEVKGAEQEWNKFLDDEEAYLKEHKEEWSDYEIEGNRLIFSQGIMLSELMNLALDFKALKRMCKKYLVVQTEKEMGTTSVYKLDKNTLSLGIPKVKSLLKKSWKVNTIRIVNEEVA